MTIRRNNLFLKTYNSEFRYLKDNLIAEGKHRNYFLTFHVNGFFMFLIDETIKLFTFPKNVLHFRTESVLLIIFSGGAAGINKVFKVPTRLLTYVFELFFPLHYRKLSNLKWGTWFCTQQRFEPTGNCQSWHSV